MVLTGIPMGTHGPVGFWLVAPGDPWEKIFMDLGMAFGTQNTHGYGFGSSTSALVPSLIGVLVHWYTRGPGILKITWGM